MELSKLFPGNYISHPRNRHPHLPTHATGATPKAIEERIAKLKREVKAADNGGSAPATPATTPSKSKIGLKRKLQEASGGVKRKPKRMATKVVYEEDNYDELEEEERVKGEESSGSMSFGEYVDGSGVKGDTGLESDED